MASAQELKEKSQQQVWQNEDNDWRDEALKLLKEFAQARPKFTADDFRDYARLHGLRQPHHPNVWGSLYTTAATKLWIRKSGDYDVSSNPNSHAHHYVVWKSMLCVEANQTASEVYTRFELRAEDKPGITRKSKQDANSMMQEYCAKYGVKPTQVRIRKLIESD